MILRLQYSNIKHVLLGAILQRRVGGRMNSLFPLTSMLCQSTVILIYRPSSLLCAETTFPVVCPSTLQGPSVIVGAKPRSRQTTEKWFCDIENWTGLQINTAAGKAQSRRKAVSKAPVMCNCKQICRTYQEST